ncbi:MAG: metal-sensitive transcriptional regulator [Patescibacteria group bacterium]|nr:metal-sensitive transcriptional regulator [Patescibacteria group bacterium]
MNTNVKLEAAKRLKIIEGHLKKIGKMVEEGNYCPSVLQQSAAVQSALKKVDEILLKGHLETCFKNAIKTNGGEKEIEELMDAFKSR